MPWVFQRARLRRTAVRPYSQATPAKCGVEVGASSPLKRICRGPLSGRLVVYREDGASLEVLPPPVKGLSR